MLLVPHGYQYEAVDSVFNYFAHKFGNPLVAMPTGTGKSVVIASLLERIFKYWPRQKVVCLTHVKELIEQNYAKLLTLWPGAPAGVNSAGLGQRDIIHPIIFAGIASVVNRAAEFGHVDLLLIDEAHLVSPSDETMYRTFINGLLAINPMLKVIGFTATPWRTGVGKLTEGGLFTDFCFDITDMHSFNRLIEEGYLSRLMPRPTDTVLDTSAVHIRGGEFVAKELQHAVDRDEITEKACAEAIQLAGDRQHWLAFCAGVHHSQSTADILNSMGITAVAIHSKMEKGERDRAISGWKSGQFQCAVNNNILTTGVDFPAIDCILMLRPTASTQLWVQMLGRGTRCVYAPGYNIGIYEERMEAIRVGGKQNCLVLDYARNTPRLGPINDPVIPAKRGERSGDAPIKICDVCGFYNHASARKCDNCGFEFPIVTKLKQTAGKEELIKGDDPITEVFKVDHITFSNHPKLGAPPSMRVTYFCNLRKFEEFVCMEHPGYPGRKAKSWWKEHTDAGMEMPAKVDDAITLCGQLKLPTHLRIWTNKGKYPQIMNRCFDGTAFGKEEALDKAPTMDVGTGRSNNPPPPTKPSDDWDDIPF